MSQACHSTDATPAGAPRGSGRGSVTGSGPYPARPAPPDTGPALDAVGLGDDRLTARLLAKSPKENFPVASRLLPARLRRDLLAVYGFARLVDDLGDEAPGDRGHLLDLVAADLDRVYRRSPEGVGPVLPVLRELATTIHAHRIPAEPFRRLIAANRQDQTVTDYQTFGDLLDYCTLSADPVGRIVLHIFDVATPERILLSDRVCSALQITEHLQDVAEDLRRGRVYLPAEDLRRFGCTRTDLADPVAGTRVRRLVGFQRRRARDLLDSGAPLVGGLPGLARLAVAGYVAGGRAALAAIAAAGDDVLAATPHPARRRLLGEWLLVGATGGAR